MQTAKNVFLWPGRDWVRKGFEAYFTVLIEVGWGKRRIMEIYLNVVEWGPGIYGAEAAARHYFSKAGSRSDDRRGSPSRCSASAQLVTAPPNPTRSSPQRCDLFEYASCIPALSPPYRLKGARAKVGSHSDPAIRLTSGANISKPVSPRLRSRWMSERSLSCCAGRRSSHSVFSASLLSAIVRPTAAAPHSDSTFQASEQ
jgi:Transglycosylase